VAFSAHLAVGQDLRNGVLGRWRLLAFIGAGQVADEVGRVVVADVLQRGSDRSAWRMIVVMVLGP
jgi:hypothetical protein